MSAIGQIVDSIRELRIAWLSEKPAAPPAASIAEVIEHLRFEYRYFRDARAQLEKAHRAIGAMMQDCDAEMLDAERFARELMAEDANANNNDGSGHS